MPGRCIRVILFVAAFALLKTAASYAAAVTLEWDANGDSVTAGYYVYYGTESGKYSGNVDVGKSTSAVLNLTDPGATYYFAVQAYSATGDKSGISSELVWRPATADGPTLRNPGSMTTVVGQSVNVQLSASDPGGLGLSYSANSLPPGLALGTGSGTISGTPTVAGVYVVTVTVTNTSSLSASQAFSWTILAQPSSPGIVGGGGSTGGGGSGTGGGSATGGGSGTGGGSTVTNPIAGGGGNGSGSGSGSGTGSGTGDGSITTPTYPVEDRTPPVINIVSPAAAGGKYQTTNVKIIVTGIASDNVGVVSMTWTNSRGGSGTTLGTSSWATNSIELQLGDNVITITAVDAAGNVQTATLTVTRIVDLINHLN